MSERDSHSGQALDRAAGEIADTRLDPLTQSQIIDRVWQRIDDGSRRPRPLQSCEDYQREIPGLVAGSLQPQRALLVEDHTLHCLACRRALLRTRGELAETGSPQPAQDSRPWLRTGARVAAVAAGLLVAAAVYLFTANVLADRGLRATVAAVDGSLLLVEPVGMADLEPGSELRSSQVVRTGAGSRALLRLQDGSLIEMNERSEISLAASRRGSSVRLQRGDVLVHAAAQDRGRLFVLTSDCRVAVKGTIFTVNHGLKGSRVSVIEGEVEVRGSTLDAVLRPGDQVATNRRLRPVPLEQEIAWSRDAQEYRALVRELASLSREVAASLDQAPPRTSSPLLDLAPRDTFVYAAMPDITDGLEEARATFENRIADSPLLRAWWQRQVVDSGIDAEIRSLLDRLQPVGNAIGSEAVLAFPRSVLEQGGSPLMMADVSDPRLLRNQLQDMLAETAGGEAPGAGVRIVDDPTHEQGDAVGLLLWIGDEVFAATPDIHTLRAFVARVEGSAPRDFAGTRLHDRIEQAYADGVSWLVAADLSVPLGDAVARASTREAALLDELGLLDLTTLVIERHRDGDWYATDFELAFASQRRGLMAWLAAPAPLGGLDFVSPDAFAAASASTRDPGQMLDDLLSALLRHDGEGWNELRRLQEELGVDLRADLIATLGGELTLALDGPMLPVPSWKVVVEVRDPATLLHGLETAVRELNRSLEAQQQPLLIFDHEDASGRSYHAIRRQGSERGVAFTVVSGYLVAGPSRAVVDHAIACRDSGVSLASSDGFRSLLPDNGYADCSAVAYRNLDAIVDAVPPELVQELAPAAALGDELGVGLVCVFADAGRITASATGGGLIGVGSLLGVAAPPGGGGADLAAAEGAEADAALATEGVSSRG